MPGKKSKEHEAHGEQTNDQPKKQPNAKKQNPKKNAPKTFFEYNLRIPKIRKVRRGAEGAAFFS